MRVFVLLEFEVQIHIDIFGGGGGGKTSKSLGITTEVCLI